MDKLAASVLTMLHEWQEQKEHPLPQELLYKHSFDIKSSKLFTTVVAVSILCFVSLVGNYFLWQSKLQYKDDALKFQIIGYGEDVDQRKSYGSIMCLTFIVMLQ